MNSLELAYTVSVLRRLSESADAYIENGSFIDHLSKDINDAQALIKAYDKRIIQQAKKESLYETV
jgi:hypothetical protein